MKVFNVVRKNTYYDSVTLMLISKQLKQEHGLDAVSVMMATPANLVILAEANLLSTEGKAAGANDLILAFRASAETDVQAVCRKIDEQIAGSGNSSDKRSEIILRTAEKAYREIPEANLALISVPGEYAAVEAFRALKHGKNVFLFSDNVTLGEEAMLKQTAAERGLLVMGPDCGTAIINNVGIGFANKVRPGNVGIVAASGTGLQEVTCLLDALGFGISQAIGTGGRDLKEEIGAATMLQALDYLLADSATHVVVLISKPPAKSVVDAIMSKLTGATKAIVLCFIGYNYGNPPAGVIVVSSLEEAALQVAVLSGCKKEILNCEAVLDGWAEQAKSKLSGKQKYVRALYAGGTLCYEAMLILSKNLGPIYSNIPLTKELSVSDATAAGRHIALDLGDDEFTKGRPHPMIDGTLRNEYIDQVASDNSTAVLLLDVVLGFGAADDPAEELVPVITAAKTRARASGNELVVVAYVCGTQLDEQNKQEQINKLIAAGVLVANSNAEAARLVSRIVKGLGADNCGCKK